MPRRRSSRLKGKATDVEEANVETALVKDIASKTNNIESVSNNNTTQSNKKLVIEEVEQKDPSEPQSLEQSPEQSPDNTSEQQPIDDQQNEPQNDNQDEDDEEEEQEEEEEAPTTLIAGRTRRKVQQKSYKDYESSEDEEDEDEDPMFAGLSKKEKQAMKEKMALIQKGCSDATLKERALKIQEIIGSFELNIDADVTEEEAAFIYDFSRKHQFDVIEKIEDEGDFFLENIREMIEEKMKLHQAAIRANGGKRKRRKDEDSESEFDMNDFEDSESDSDYSMDSEFENPFLDNDNMIDEDEDEEDYANYGARKRRRGGKRRRNKNVYKVDGREYYAKGRLLLTDALKDTENFEGWSAARVKAWKNKEYNPNAYHYRFNLPGEEAVNGGLQDREIKPFMERVKEVGVNVHWGTFSMVIKGRVGYQCSNYWRQMIKDGWVKDPNYWILPDGKLNFKRGKQRDVPENIRRYSFVVLHDPSGTFGPDFPAFHPKRASDAQLKKYLETDVRDLDDSVKAGKGKKKKSKGKGKKKEDDKDDNETKDNKEEEETKGDDKNDDETTDNKETKKSKKKGSKKKKDKKKKSKKDKKDGDDENEEEDNDNEENDETKDTKTKKKKKSKSKKSKKSSKKDKKKKDKKSKSKKKKKKSKKGNDEEQDTEDKENEVEEETASKSKRGKKRKHAESAGEDSSELEPPQKKRKKMNKSKKGKKEDENEEQTDDKLEDILGDMVDIMTGDKLIDPAISPFGYVMSYNSWCSILRNSKTKNQCPFTKKKLTRRSLIKLTQENIEQYKDDIVNITEEDRKNFML